MSTIAYAFCKNMGTSSVSLLFFRGDARVPEPLPELLEEELMRLQKKLRPGECDRIK